MWIQCNHFNKKFTYKLSETVTIDIITIFIKTIVFHHVILLCIIKTREKNDFAVDDNFTLWCTGDPWFNQTH